MKTYINITILCLSMLSASVLEAQIGTGLVLEDEAYNSSLQVPQAFASGVDDELPSKVSMKEYCPKVVNQGQIGSCVGWSSGYGAFTIMRAKEEGWTDVDKITANAFSALYIYNQVKLGDCYQGSLFSQALNFLKENGSCLSSDFDYPKDDCDRKPDEEHKVAANKSPYEVRDYFTIFRSTADKEEKIRQTKLSLSEGKPVIIGMMIRENFKDLSKEDSFWKPDSGNTASAGGHAMVVIGYNDDKNAFEVMNSWGEKWGNDGYFWVKYDDFAKFCVYGYQLLIGKKSIGDETKKVLDPFAPIEGVTMSDSKDKPTVEMSAEFVFRYPVDYDEATEKVIFEEATPSLNEHFYTFECELEQRFQLLTRKITKDRYVYVFSIDPNNDSKVHWPRSAKFDNSSFGFEEGAIVPYKNVNIIMPGKDKALIKDKTGKDKLIVLYSYRPIDDLMERIEEVKSGSGDYLERLQKTFGKRLIPTEDIKYTSNKMKFSASSSSGGYIVPIVLEVSTK